MVSRSETAHEFQLVFCMKIELMQRTHLCTDKNTQFAVTALACSLLNFRTRH